MVPARGGGPGESLAVEQLRFETTDGRVLQLTDTPELSGLRDGDTVVVHVPS
eukprot:COSAG05_NODE_1057_length_6003_cov_186.405488_1_plen_52_part_00